MLKKVDYHIDGDTLYIKKLDSSELNKNWLHLIKKNQVIQIMKRRYFKIFK